MPKSDDIQVDWSDLVETLDEIVDECHQMQKKEADVEFIVDNFTTA